MMNSQTWETIARYNAFKARTQEAEQRNRTAEHADAERQYRAAVHRGDTQRSSFWYRVKQELVCGREWNVALSTVSKQRDFMFDSYNAHNGLYNYWRAV